VVEDDVALLALIETCLNRQGFRTVGAADGASALQWLDSHTPQLMLLDYSLPDMQGEELLTHLEARGQRVPFIVVTGHGSESVAVEMMKRGAQDYVTKGGSFVKLLPTVLAQVLARLRQAERLLEAEEELRTAHSELEQRVRQRTAELAEANQRLRVEIDERRRAEEQLQGHQAELAHVARLSTMGEMVAELAHELNQPLSAICSYAQACQRLVHLGAADHVEALVTSLNQVGEQADRAAGIIRRLKQFVTKAKPAQISVDVNALLHDVADLVHLDARLAKAQIHFDLADPLPPVRADRIQIEQVMVNLMRNGFEAMRESENGPRLLTVRTEIQPAGHILVTVHDTGGGISPEARPQIFDRFYTTKADGMGMGLPISQSIIESHGGRLWAAPNSDCGATFFFTLPIHHGEQHHG
jgi:C4-dicarboxylate-specific signal transduction histidine kinase